MQRLVLFVGFMAFGSGMVYLLAVRETPPRVAESIEIPSNVFAMTGVVFRQHQQESIRYELLAREAVFDQRTEETTLEAVELFVFDVDGERPPPLVLRATARRAVVDKKGGLVTLLGSVRLFAADGTEIRSEKIDYRQQEQTIHSPGPAWVKARDVVHQATSLVYDIPRERIRFTAPSFTQ